MSMKSCPATEQKLWPLSMRRGSHSLYSNAEHVHANIPYLCHRIVLKKSLKILKGGNQKSSIEEGQTTQWQKEKDKRTNNYTQNITQKSKGRAKRTPFKTGGQLKSCPLSEIKKNEHKKQTPIKTGTKDCRRVLFHNW